VSAPTTGGRLASRVSIVSGGAQGIGGAIARRFAAEGSRVAILDLVEAKAAETVERIRGSGGECAFIRCDVREQAQVEAAVAATVQAFGRLDVCVSAAGVGRMIDYLSMTRADFEDVLAVNLSGPFMLGQLAARQMIAQGGGGSIVHVSSVSALLANPGQVAYCASKAGLGGLTRAMAVTLAPQGIRVNEIAPGPTYTAQSAAAFDDPRFGPMIRSRTPLGRFAQPDEMAGAALLLASDDGSFMTGETIFVDGGRLALNYVMPTA
jgi:glucose 1-dehydrogenase